MDWLEFLAAYNLQPDTITVEALRASGAYGPTYDLAVDVTGCVVQDGVRAVKVQTSGASGKVKTSTCQVWAPPGATIPVGSRVTLPSGRQATVITADVLTANGQDLPEHLELALE